MSLEYRLKIGRRAITKLLVLFLYFSKLHYPRDKSAYEVSFTCHGKLKLHSFSEITMLTLVNVINFKAAYDLFDLIPTDAFGAS